MVTDELISGRKSLYTWCFANATWARHQAMVIGDVAAVAKHWATMKLLRWGIDVLCRYPVGDSVCAGQRNSTDEDVCCVIRLVDPCCATPACGVQTIPTPTSCDPVIYDTVIRAVQVVDRADIEAAVPVEGDSYLIVAGSTPNPPWAINYIVTWTSGAWVAVLVTTGQIIQALDTGTLWTVQGGSIGMLYPPVTADLVGANGLYSIISQYPTISTAMARQVRLRGFINGAWVTLFEGPETALATATNYNLAGSQLTNLVVTYLLGECSWTSSVLATPPFGQCGVIVVVVTPEADCGNEQFFIAIDIQSVTGYPLGNIITTVNGVDQPPVAASLGINVTGFFGLTDVVTVRIENAFDSDCDYTSSSIAHPQMPLPDTTVTAAVDASFQGSQQPTGRYLVVSNTGNLVNTWANNIGRIWDGPTNAFVTPANLSVIRNLAVSGAPAYWQMSAGLPIQIYPPVTFRYNTVTQVWVALAFPVAPILSAGIADIIVTHTCAGITETDYAGAPDDFTDTGFSTLCGYTGVTGAINYFNPCIVSVPAIKVQFTPTGEVDPGFSSVGLNNTVRDARSQTNDQMLVGGNFTFYGAIPVGRFGRMLPNGTLDLAFNTALGAGFDATVFTIGVEESGSSIVAGDFLNFNGVATPRIARISSSGAQDATFNANIGTGPNFSIRKVHILPSGKILCTGEFTSWNGVPTGRIILLNQDGTPDAAFALASGTGFNSTPGVTERASDGTFIIANGFASAYNGTAIAPGGDSIVSINEDGTFNSIITIGTGFAGDPTHISIQPDGKLVVTGAFLSYNGVTVNRIARLNTDGTLDLAFLANTGSGFSVGASGSIVLPSGQILIACGVGNFNGLAANSLVLLNANGTRDVNYNTGPGPNNAVVSPVISAFGNVWIYGTFTFVDGIPRLRISRLS